MHGSRFNWRRGHLDAATLIACSCFLVATVIHCSKGLEKHASIVNASDAEASVRRTLDATTIVGEISKGKWRETILPGRESLRAVQFTSTARGWVGSDDGSLYRTRDGGATWNRVYLGNRQGKYIVSLNFIGDKLGWAVFSSYPKDYSDYKKYSARIFYTEDSGYNWKVQYERPQAAINQLRFNHQEGWATGVSYAGKSSGRTSYLLLHTSDYGKHWMDLSKQFEDAVISTANYDFPVDVYSDKPSQATVLTVGGRVVRTENGGGSWKEIARINDEFEQTGFVRIGILDNDTIWTLGGADSKEGVWGLVSSLNRDNSWTSYRARQMFYKDAVFLGGGNVIACGSTPDYEDVRKVTFRRSAIISYSSDNGRTWSIVYRTRKANSIHALSVSSSTNIWAVGERGLLLHLAV